jgi:hypothetical protein
MKPHSFGCGGYEMANAVKIRTLTAPPTPLSEFDPGAYLSELEFYETDSPVSDEDRDGLAQFVHFLAFLALQAQSSRWPSSVVPRGSQAHRALESHFGHLAGWPVVAAGGLPYRELAGLLMQHYPPRPPKK